MQKSLPFILAAAALGCHVRAIPVISTPPGFSVSHESVDGTLNKKQDATLSDQMTLPDELREVARAHPFSQRRGQHVRLNRFFFVSEKIFGCPTWHGRLSQHPLLD